MGQHVALCVTGRETRLGEFSPFGRVYFGRFFDNYKREWAKFLGYFSHRNSFCIKFDKIKIGQHFEHLFHESIRPHW
jgi:hypothetical protein